MSIKELALQKAIAMLQGANAKYKIVDEEGKEYSNFVESKKRRSEFPFGSITNHLKPYIEDMSVGQLVEIPAMHFPLESLQSTTTAWFCTNVGKGSCMTAINRDKNVVEVIRLI